MLSRCEISSHSRSRYRTDDASPVLNGTSSKCRTKKRDEQQTEEDAAGAVLLLTRGFGCGRTTGHAPCKASYHHRTSKLFCYKLQRRLHVFTPGNQNGRLRGARDRRPCRRKMRPAPGSVRVVNDVEDNAMQIETGKQNAQCILFDTRCGSWRRKSADPDGSALQQPWWTHMDSRLRSLPVRILAESGTDMAQACIKVTRSVSVPLKGVSGRNDKKQQRQW